MLGGGGEWGTPAGAAVGMFCALEASLDSETPQGERTVGERVALAVVVAGDGAAVESLSCRLGLAGTVVALRWAPSEQSWPILRTWSHASVVLPHPSAPAEPDWRE